VSAYCYNGECRTHQSQCRLWWGDSAENGNQYDLNVRGEWAANCGYNFTSDQYAQCSRFVFTRATRVSIAAVIVCLSVCPSVTRRYCVKTAKHRTRQTTPRDSPGTPVFWRQQSLVGDPIPLNLGSKWPTHFQTL